MKKLIAVVAVSFLALGTSMVRAQDAAEKPATPATNNAAAPAEAAPANPPVQTPPPVAPQTNSAPSTAKNIRFQFDGIPYMDVVERFSQMVHKPLITDTNVQGTLSYNDPNPYSYQEALDTLNIILSMKGVTLVETENHLRLVPFRQLPQLPIKIMRGLNYTGDVRPGEVVTVVLDVKSLDSKEVADSVTPMLSNAGSIAPLSKGRGLIVTDRLENIQRIRTLISTIDIETNTNRKMRTYTLLHASGAIVSDLLNRTFGLATAPKRTQYNPNTKNLDTLPPDPNDYITSVYDEASRTMVLFGPDERMELAEELINRFEQRGGPGGDVRIYYPQVTKAEELATIIRQAIPGVAAPNETAATSATKARLIADSAQNRLIVAAPIPGQLDQIEQLINRVDKPVHGNTSSTNVPIRSTTIQLTKVFRPRAADATNVAAILTQALTRRSSSGQIQTTASVSHEPASQSVIISGSPGDLQIATDIVSQLETGTTNPTPLQTRFIDVGTVAEAKRLQPLVEQLYRNQVSDGSVGAVAHAKILADTESGRLIVTASEDHLTKIETLVKQLRGDRPANQGRQLEIVQIKNLRVTDAAKSVTDLVAEKMKDKRFADLPAPTIIPDTANNRLLVTATADQITEVRQIVDVIDIAPDKASREMRVIPLQAKSASEIIPLVTSLLEQSADGTVSPQSAPKLIADPSGKQVIALAVSRDLERIEKFVQQFDAVVSTNIARQFRTVELFTRTAADLTPLVQQLYTEQLRGQLEPAGGPATLLPDARNNQIMVSGSEREIGRVETIIRQLDPAGRKPAREETRVVRLKSANATELVGLVEKSLNSQQQVVRVLLDARSNSLVLSGEPAALETAVQLISQLDTRPNLEPREMRIIELKAAEANVITPMVNNLFSEFLKDRRGADYVTQTKIIPDATANRIVVTGARDEIDEVVAIVNKLDHTPEQAPNARVFKLTSGDATVLAPIVSQAMMRFNERGLPIRRMTVTADAKSNSLIVSGTRTDLQDVAAIIEKLDGEGSLKEKSLKVIDVKSEDVNALSALAIKVFQAQNPNSPSLVNITPEPAGKRLIVLAPSSMISQVEELISKLDSNPKVTPRETRTFDLGRLAEAQRVLPLAQQLYRDQVTSNPSLGPADAQFVSDSRTGRIIVSARATQLEPIANIISSLQVTAATNQTPRETKTFEVGNAGDVQRLLPIVQQLYQDHWKDKIETDPADAQIVPDPRTGRLIVTGKPEHVKQIEAILQQVGTGKAKPQARETRVFDLSTANAMELATTVRTLYTEQSRNNPAAAETLILPDASANRLIIVGDDTELNAVEEIVRKLDKVSAQSASTRVFKLKYAEPQKVAEILSTALVRYDAYGRQQRRVSVVVDDKTRTIIATGDPKELQGASVIIEQLDSSLGEQPARQMKVYQVKSGRVADLVTKVRQLYQDQIKNQPELALGDALIMEDYSSNQLILAGNEAQIALIESIASKLQETQTQLGQRETRLIDIGQPEEVNRILPLVQQLYQEKWRNNDASDPADAQIMADLKNARLIVTGRTNHLSTIEGIIAQIGTPLTNNVSRDTRVYDLSTANAMELSTTVRTLYQEESRNRPNARPSETVIIPDASANRILVTGNTNELEIIDEIIRKLDKVSAQSASTRVFKLKSGDPEKVAEILSTALVRYDAYGRQQRRVSVVVDAKTRTLIATGDPKELQGASVIIEQLDSSLGDQPSRQMRVIPLKTARVAELSSKVRQLYQDQARNQPELAVSDALILEDVPGNQLIIAGSEPQIALIEKITAQLQDAQIPRGPRETRLIPIGQADQLQRLQPLVQQIYQERWQSRDASDPADAQIIADTANARFIVTGRTNHLDEIAAIVQQVNAPISNAEPRDTRVYDLSTSSASELVATVRSLYTEDLKTRSAPVSGQATILPDLAANRIVVSGSSNEMHVVEEIITKLDKVSPKTGNARVFKLKNADANQVASLVSTALTRVNNFGRQIARVSIGADVPNNLLIVTGEPKDLQAAEVIIEQMDSITAPEKRQMRIIAIKEGTARQVATRIEALYQDQLKGKAGAGAADALIMGDDVSNRLLVTASETHLKLIEEIVSQLQEAQSGAGRQIRVMPIAGNSATSIAAMISQVFTQQVASRDAGERLVVSALPDDRTLVVDANAPTLEKIENLVKTLDTAQSDGQGIIQAIHLKKGRAEDLAVAVNASLTNRTATPRLQKVRVTPVQGGNSLLISGPQESVQEVMKIVNELDTESTSGEIEVRIYKLENGRAREVSSVIQQLLFNVTRQTRQEGGRFLPASVSVDEKSNSLIVSGASSHFRVLEKLLPTLDKAPERSDRDVQFVFLRKAKAYDVVSKVSAVFEDRDRDDRPVIEADPLNNSITIIARRPDIAQIQDLIARLDDTAKDTTMQVRLRPLESIAAEQMARMLQNIYPQMGGGTVRVVEKIANTNAPATNATAEASITNTSPEVVVAIDRQANALLLSGPAQELDNIDRLINDLSFSFYGNEAEFRVFPLKHADPVVVARLMTELIRPEPVQVQPAQGQQVRVRQNQPRITIVPEPRTRGIIVRARPTDFALLESIVKQLDGAGELAQVQHRIVPLTNASPFRIQTMVQQMVTQMNTARPGEPVSVVPDFHSRGLLVIGRGTQLDQIEEFIRSLDKPSKTAEAEVLIVELKKASANQVAQVLNNMIRPGTDGELTRENQSLQEQIRRLKVQNDKGDAVNLDLSRPIKIAADGQGPNAGNRLVITSSEDNLVALQSIIEMLDQPNLTEGVEVQLFSLRHADATTVEQTLNNIFTEGARLNVGPTGVGRGQAEGDLGRAFASPLNVAVDQRSNTLILSGRKETLSLATRLLTEIDQKLERSLTEIKLFRLKHASAVRVLPLLQSVFAEGAAVPGTEGLNMQVSRLRTLRNPNAPKTNEVSRIRPALVIQADDLSNILIISARTDTMPLIEEIIDQLDIPAASGLESVRIYPLNQADPTSIQRIINELYTGPRAATLRNEDRPVVSIDQRTSALIVAGNSKAFGIIESLLAQLDQKLPFELRDIRLIPLENSDASVLSSTLQRMMDARVTQRAALNRGEADALKVIIIPDDRSNSLIVGGSKDSFDLVQTLAQQLDKAAPSIAGRIRIVPLTQADARVIASTLTTLFTQRYAAARTSDVQRNRPIIMPDPRSNSLLVAASVEDNNAIDELLKKLDQKMENPALLLTVVPLKHNDAARVTSIIETIFAARLRAQTIPGQTPNPADAIEVQPDAINNALIISASKENLEHIQALLQKIDVEPQIAGGLLQTFTLEFADASRVANLLRSLVDQGLYRPGTPVGAGATRLPGRDSLAVAVDPRSNTLIISASPENLAVAKDIIRRLDTKDYTDATNVRLYQLKHARASSLAVTLTQFFAAKRAGDAVALNATERSIPVSVIADDRVNSLIVTGSKEAFETVERLLAQLDGEGIFSRMNFRVFPLKQATAQKLQPVLQQIFANRPPRVRGEPLDPITIVADSWVNALLVGASVEDMSSVEALLQKLDSEQTDPGLAVHVFPLAKADARRIATTIQSLYRDNTPGVALPITVSADERINAIVVSAGESDAKRIGELVKKLDTDQVARVSEIKVFPLQYARAETLSTILNTALNTKPAPLSDANPNAQSVLQFITRTTEGQELVTAALKEGVLITPDSRMNSLIVSGPVDYMGLLEQIITRLDASSPQQAKIKVFTLQNADARQMAELLVAMFRMTASSVNGPQRSIQYTLVRPRFDNNGVAVEEEQLASATLGTAEQNALTVTVDPRTNSLLIGGTDHYVNLVSQIIESLDATPANERRTEVVRLKNSQAQEVATAIRNFLDQERQRVTAVLGAEAVGTAQRLLEREVAVVAEPLSNTLLLSANPRYFEQIKDIINELDKPQQQVLIQVLLAEVTLDSLTDLGVEWSYHGTSGGGDVQYGIGTDFNVARELTTFGGYSTAISGKDFSFLLRALKNDGRLEVLSRPQIVTADNKPAAINIGQRVPLITDSRVTERGDTINQFRYEDIGVNLAVTPKISPDGFVKMEISTTNSSISSSTVAINASATVPIINQRRANTTVSVQSGQTIIIGGLIATLDDQRLKKVPVLGDIPYLGALFRSKHTSKERKELLVLLTPQVLANAEGTGTIRPIDDVTREQLDKSRIKDEIKRDQLQKQILDPLFPQDFFQQENTPRPKT